MPAVSFGYKATWLAVRDGSAGVVADALELPERRTVGWHDGVDAAYRGELLITAPVDGWTFAVTAPGHALPDLSDAGFAEWFGKLSARLGTVRCFVTHRVVELHGWARAELGRVERVYCYLGERGEVLADIGQRTADEVGGEPDEDDVLRLAGLWSVNPAELDGRDVPGDCLVAGRPPESRWRTGWPRR
ncbi:hypothetical protein [Kibdelosporangium phytohabitans]|uniref:Uncharacterized protein n=1 Tax=Kibdelosporangium phytohabitans TaxID=860235 RepID=A0A0N9I9N8_9PSEU|nr:hypothetical protein [Kibdelosporangium phytohabitans]ALG11364.1 hypothetical protein AOZ06_34855 [Kibdelosporangium phytohabitans]MBE1462685.1 hypothetical protein [Kibdelosporangium phytohabitans]